MSTLLIDPIQIMAPSSLSCRLIVLTGPSGVGKGTLVKKLLLRHQELWLSVSATTRVPREGEIDGQDYFFLEQQKFDDLINNDGFLEWAEFAGNFYGTPIKEVREKLDIGRPVLLEIELNGARQVRKTFPDALQIFLEPPSFDELERRIRGRATDTEDAIQRRLTTAKDELNASNEFDAVVINDDIDVAFSKLEEAIGFQ